MPAPPPAPPFPAEPVPQPPVHHFLDNRMAAGRGPRQNPRLAMASTLARQFSLAHALRGHAPGAVVKPRPW